MQATEATFLVIGININIRQMTTNTDLIILIQNLVKYACWLIEIYYALEGTTIKSFRPFCFYLVWQSYLKLVSLQPKIDKSLFRNEPLCLRLFHNICAKWVDVYDASILWHRWGRDFGYTWLHLSLRQDSPKKVESGNEIYGGNSQNLGTFHGL